MLSGGCRERSWGPPVLPTNDQQPLKEINWKSFTKPTLVNVTHFWILDRPDEQEIFRFSIPFNELQARHGVDCSDGCKDCDLVFWLVQRRDRVWNSSVLPELLREDIPFKSNAKVWEQLVVNRLIAFEQSRCDFWILIGEIFDIFQSNWNRNCYRFDLNLSWCSLTFIRYQILSINTVRHIGKHNATTQHRRQQPIPTESGPPHDQQLINKPTNSVTLSTLLAQTHRETKCVENFKYSL